MCPVALLQVAAIMIVAVGVVSAYRRQIESARCNARILSEVLQSVVNTDGFLKINFALEGFYKTRKVGYVYHLSDKQYNPYSRLFVEPKFFSHNRSQPWFRLWYFKPTPHTYLKGARIYYAGPLGFTRMTWGGLAVMRREDVQQVLEELVRAAELVEKQNV